MASELRGLKPAMTENELLQEVKKLAKLYHWKLAHFRPAMTSKGWRTAIEGNVGFPDVVLARQHPPGFITMELKSETGKLTSEQADWMITLRASGISAGVYKPSDLEIIARMLK